jgi:hypothetical protein
VFFFLPGSSDFSLFCNPSYVGSILPPLPKFLDNPFIALSWFDRVPDEPHVRSELARWRAWKRWLFFLKTRISLSIGFLVHFTLLGKVPNAQAPDDDRERKRKKEQCVGANRHVFQRIDGFGGETI